MSFASDLANYAKKTKLGIDKAVVAINAQITTDIIENTPADTGRAKGNWFASFEASSNETTESTHSQLNDALAKANNSAGKVFYLTNNLPYINRLEYGWSKQAPSGMVRVSIKNANKALREFKTTK